MVSRNNQDHPKKEFHHVTTHPRPAFIQLFTGVLIKFSFGFERKCGNFEDFIFKKAFQHKRHLLVRFFKTISSQCKTEKIGINQQAGKTGNWKSMRPLVAE